MAASAEDHRQRFDEWLLHLDPFALDDLDVTALAQRARQDGVSLPQLTFLTVIAETDEPFAALRHGAGHAVSAERQTAQGGLLCTEANGRQYVVGLWRSSMERVHHIVASVPVTDNRWRRVEQTWLAGAAPRLAPVILNKHDFEDVGDALSEHGTVEVSRLTARVLKDNSSYTRGWQDKIARRPTHRQAMAETSDMLVRTVMLSVGDRLSVHLRRHAGATYYRGDYGLFCKVILRRLTSAAAARLKMLTGRERHPSQPITESLIMRLAESALSTSKERTKLLETVSHISNVQVAVYHRNPYLHFAVTDYLDGSNLDVFVTEDDRVSLLPGYHASVGSLARITDVIGEALGMIDLETEATDELIADEEFFVG